MTVPGLRRQLGRFERAVAKNAEQRGKFPDDPSKCVLDVRQLTSLSSLLTPPIRFIESESDLDSSLNQFLPLTQNPPAFYPELVRSGTIALLMNLLSHENTDIAIDVIQVIQELTDEDVGGGGEAAEEDLDGPEADIAARTPMAMAEFIDEMVSQTSFSNSGEDGFVESSS